MKTVLALVLLAGGLFGIEQTAYGTVVEAMNVETLASRSTHVVHGRVTQSGAAWVNGRIETRIELRIETLWGNPEDEAPTVTVAIPGGQVGELAQRVSGSPRLNVGEEVVLFLWREPAKTRGDFRIVSLNQGTYRVFREGSRTRAVSTREGSYTGLEAHCMEQRKMNSRMNWTSWSCFNESQEVGALRRPALQEVIGDADEQVDHGGPVGCVSMGRLVGGARVCGVFYIGGYSPGDLHASSTSKTDLAGGCRPVLGGNSPD